MAKKIDLSKTIPKDVKLGDEFKKEDFGGFADLSFEKSKRVMLMRIDYHFQDEKGVNFIAKIKHDDYIEKKD